MKHCSCRYNDRRTWRDMYDKERKLVRTDCTRCGRFIGLRPVWVDKQNKRTAKRTLTGGMR